VKRKKD